MDKEATAIKRLQAASDMSLQAYKQPLVVTTSGGKDSSVCVELAIRAGIPFEVMHNLTTVDAPETVNFVKGEFKRLEDNGIKCNIDIPYYDSGKRATMWNLIPIKLMPPTRLVRYCCQVLKERGGENRFITTGVRWEESRARKDRGMYETISKKKADKIVLNNDNDDTRRLFENCKLKAKRVCNPIIDWTDEDVWDYINSENIPLNPLYKCGFSRIGCIGCPMARKVGREIQFARYPIYKKNYIKAFDKMIELRRRKGLKSYGWGTGIDVFHWWMEDGVLPGQITFDGLED